MLLQVVVYLIVAEARGAREQLIGGDDFLVVRLFQSAQVVRMLDELIGRYSNLGYVGILVLRKPSMSLPSASTCGARAA